MKCHGFNYGVGGEYFFDDGNNDRVTFRANWGCGIHGATDRKALYLNTQGFRIGCRDAVLQIKEKDHVADQVRAHSVVSTSGTHDDDGPRIQQSLDGGCLGAVFAGRPDGDAR